MSIEAVNAVLEHSESRGATRLVLIALAERSSQKNDYRAQAVVARIAQVSGKNDKQSARNFRQALDEAFPLDTDQKPKKKKLWWLRRPGDE